MDKDQLLFEMAEAIRLTHQYIDPAGEILPARPGWVWYDALVAYDKEYAAAYEREVLKQRTVVEREINAKD